MHVRPANYEADSVVLHDSDPMFKYGFFSPFFVRLMLWFRAVQIS
jgi:hypothetical protein